MTAAEVDPSWDPDDLRLLALLADGTTIDGAARKVGISDRTVRRRLRVLADELGVETTIEVVVRAVRSGVI